MTTFQSFSLALYQICHKNFSPLPARGVFSLAGTVYTKKCTQTKEEHNRLPLCSDGDQEKDSNLFVINAKLLLRLLDAITPHGWQFTVLSSRCQSPAHRKFHHVWTIISSGVPFSYPSRQRGTYEKVFTPWKKNYINNSPTTCSSQLWGFLHSNFSDLKKCWRIPFPLHPVPRMMGTELWPYSLVQE